MNRAGLAAITLQESREADAADIMLRDGDRLVVLPKPPQSVTVIGKLNYPSSHIFDPKLSRDDYIQRSGGFAQLADKSGIYAIRASGEVIGASSSAWFQSEQKIEVGDTIVVPLEADRIRPLKLWTSIAQIIYQLGLAAAAANAAGVFD
jgi:hypothetical protein